jgi:hypothetical protein
LANARGRSLKVVTASTEADLELAFAAMVRQRIGAFIVLTDPFLDSRPHR